MAKPIVALVGRPNVGKSTLFNRLAGERLAVVHDAPGTTRDRIVAESEWNGVQFDVVDTGGIEVVTRRGGEPLAVDSAQFLPAVRAQAEMAIAEADAVIFLVEVVAGVTPADVEVANILRRHQRKAAGRPVPPVLLVANKADSAPRREQAVEFYELGMGDPYPISALHGTGTGDLLDALVAVLPAPAVEEAADAVKIAIVGRPNVGKSSLLNRLLGEERAIVSPIPGTTRDALDTPYEHAGRPIILIDTAGIRRRGRIDRTVEKWSVLRALKAIERADVALLLIDAAEGVLAQDAHIAGFILDKFRSAVIVVNKWDLVPKDSHTLDEFTARVRADLHFLGYAPLVFISAKTGQRVDQVLPTALRVQAERRLRVPTGELNRLVREATARHAPPSRSGKRLRITYAAQVNVDPPTFLFHVNDPALVHFTYQRYLENRLREAYGFLGTPLRMSFRKKSE